MSIVVYTAIGFMILMMCGLVLLVSNKNKLFEIIKNKIPIPTRMIIKDSIPYQFYKSNFSLFLFVLGFFCVVELLFFSLVYTILIKTFGIL